MAEASSSIIPDLAKGIRERLKDLDEEARRLRTTLGILEADSVPAISPRRRRGAIAQRQHASEILTPAKEKVRRSRTDKAAAGATRERIMGALREAGGAPLTAGDIATQQGLGRNSVSTTLSKMARAGEVSKARRGYMVAA